MTMLTCKFCGSHNLKRVGGNNGNPFDRQEESLVCADCGRTLAGEPSLQLLPMLVSKIEKEINEATPWRARASAQTLLNFLNGLSLCEENYQTAVELYELLSKFYRNVCDVKNAYLMAKKGSNIAFAFFDLALSADMAYIAYRHAWSLPEEIRPIIDEEKIQKDYGRYAANVLSYRRFSPMKVDPIEHTEAFLSVYDEVMERVQARLNKEGNLHIPQQIWSLMSEEFAKKGVVWRNPGLMNPTWRFD